MSGSPELDGRRANALEAELLRRAQAVLSGDGRNPQAGPVARAIFGVAARLGEEVIRRLDQAPAKQEDNFYTAAGIGRDPARPASVPVALKLVDGTAEVLTAPRQLQLMVDAGGPVFFETETRIDLAPGTISALRGIDATADSITIPSGAVMAAILPGPQSMPRRLRSGAAAGASKVQIDPAAGLAPGMLLRIGEGEAARHYEAVAVEGDLVTLEPPLETGLDGKAPVVEVGEFAPFQSVTRNRQGHALYLGHASLLDIPSAVTITISGAPLPAEARWSWWGQLGDDDPPGWQPLGSGTRFTKLPGKLVKKKIGAHESLWLRAELPGKSAGSSRVQDLRIGIGAGGACGLPHEQRCGLSDEMSVGFEAVANTAPVVTNQPFHPFGLEPRLFDSFYVGSTEAFSKVGAEVSLCFKLAGADLGPIAGITEFDATRFFATGTDGLLYRTEMTATATVVANLRPLPPPSNSKGAVFLQPQSPVALWKKGSAKHVAVAAADRESLYVAVLQDGAPLSATTWMRLPFGLKLAAKVDAIAVHGGASAAFLYALVGTDLYIWNNVVNGSPPAKHPMPVRSLAQIEPADPLDSQYPDAVLFVEDVSGTFTLERRGTAPLIIGPVGPANLPDRDLRAFEPPLDPNSLFIAGYDLVTNQWALQLTEVDVSAATVQKHPANWASGERLPIAFSTGHPILLTSSTVTKHRPMLSLAAASPVHVVWHQGPVSGSISPRIVRDPSSIGASANPYRGFCRTRRFTAVQQPGVGLFFRVSPYRAIVGDLRIPLPPATRGYLVDTAKIPMGSTHYVYFNSSVPPPVKGEPMTIVGSPASSGKHVMAMVNPAGPFPAAADRIVAFNESLTTAPITSWVGNVITLAGSGPGTPGSTFDALINADVWHLPTNNNTDEWLYSGPSPGATYKKLSELGRQTGWGEAVVIAAPSAIDAALAAGLDVWRIDGVGLAAVDFLSFAGHEAVTYPHADITFDKEALFLAVPKIWQMVGPDLAASPVLSWEYWNGQSWWALKTLASSSSDLIDNTDNLLQSGGVFFKVPADIQPTEVVGRENHWLRVRLVGGGYGEAKVTVTSTTSGTSPVVTDQVVTRDLGSIRAPYVTSLKLGYCAPELVRPEIVLTEDSLGSIDQTSANEAGLVFPVFTPVGELMNPVDAAETAVAAEAEAERCDIPCPPPPAGPGAVCDAPGAYESCDSPCIAPDGQRVPTEGEAAGFVRGLMLGFERGFAGDNVSLYVDAVPSGPPVRLAADMLRNGRFVPIAVTGDTSYGLTEPGILTLAIPAPPDRSDLLGSPAHWVRLRPKADSANWSPRLRGIHLNAVLARSIETREMERLGTSTGLAGQVFRLSEAPVDPGSLKLRVRETLAEEDDPEGRLDVQEYPGGLPGKWVRWAAAEDLIEGDSPERAFILDAEQGVIRFGDGKAGRIPPLGGDILAETYARVIGDRANRALPGQKFQLLSPLAGVESATALDHAAGGSDAEALESARRGAPAKIRHGGHILTRADLEDHALTLSPRIAQVRAETRGGVVRLIVALKGADPRPTPAALRGYASAIREVAGYGLGRPGGLEAVGPRLLPIAVALVLQPRSPDLFAEAAVQAKERLVALFDPATGNHDGKGWPLGRLPDAQDVAAALTAIEALALPVQVTLERAGKETADARELPETLPSDVLARLDPADVTLERPREAAL